MNEMFCLESELLCESEKREHFDLTLEFYFAKNWSICYCIYFIAIFTKIILIAVWSCQSYIKSVYAFLIRTESLQTEYSRILHVCILPYMAPCLTLDYEESVFFARMPRSYARAQMQTSLSSRAKETVRSSQSSPLGAVFRHVKIRYPCAHKLIVQNG